MLREIIICILLISCDAGHKHKMRCARQGVAPNKTILTPASSTAPSTTPSEASAPVRSVTDIPCSERQVQQTRIPLQVLLHTGGKTSIWIPTKFIQDHCHGPGRGSQKVTGPRPRGNPSCPRQTGWGHQPQ